MFEQRGAGALNPESLSLTLRRLVDRAAVTPLTMTGLRHAHAALALRAAVDPRVVSQHLGHSTLRIVDRQPARRPPLDFLAAELGVPPRFRESRPSPPHLHLPPLASSHQRPLAVELQRVYL